MLFCPLLKKKKKKEILTVNLYCFLSLEWDVKGHVKKSPSC